jgi:hypothetical protein
MKSIHNRFERIVIEKINAEASKWPMLMQNPDLLADAACIALNALRPHYIRHNSNLGFFMTDEKRAQEELEVNAAVESALLYVQHGDRAKGLPESR